MIKTCISKIYSITFYIGVLLFSSSSFSQYQEIQSGDLERINTKNNKLGLENNHNVFHKFIFEVENFDEYTPYLEKLENKLKKTNRFEDFSISKTDKLITLICNEESSTTFIPNLKTILAENGFRLYKIQEILLEKIEAE